MYSHLSWVSFMWQDTFLFLCSQNVNHLWGQDSGNGKRPVKRGKGQGGQKALYATQISPAAHVHIVRDMEYASSTVLCMKFAKCIHGPL